MVRDEEHAAARRDVLDAARAGAEVVAVQPARDAGRAAEAIARQPERIEAELVAADDERLGAAGDVVVGRGGQGAAQLPETIEQAHARSMPGPTCVMLRLVSESFVDLTYRGLPLGRRIKLTQVRPSSGYLELAAPMPVGTAIVDHHR